MRRGNGEGEGEGEARTEKRKEKGKGKEYLREEKRNGQKKINNEKWSEITPGRCSIKCPEKTDENM